MKKYLSFLVIALILLSAALAFNRTEAADGAAVVNVNAPAVSGTLVSVSGSATSGTVRCTGGGGTGNVNLCNCCLPGAGQGGTWNTCQITSVSYAINGPASRSGTVSQTNNTNSPAGCSLSCMPPDGSIEPICQQQKEFSLSESNLPPGDYTVTVTSSDCRGTNSASRTFTVAQTNRTLTVSKAGTGSGTVTSSPAGVSCGASCASASASYMQGTNVTLTASSSSNSTFTGWSGSGCSGTGSCSVTMSQNRSVTATFNLRPGPTVTCTGSPTSPQVGQTVRWTASPQGGTGSYTYSWTGNGSFPNGTTTNPVTAVYNAAGTKNANVTVTSGGQSATGSCSVVVPDITGVLVRVHSNRDTTFSLSGPTPQNNQTLVASSTRDFAGNSGTYTISPASQPNCLVEVNPSATQSVSGGGSITFNINYTCPTVVTAPACTASPTTIVARGTTTFTVTNPAAGTTYNWSAPGGIPSSGTGTSRSVRYNSSGTKTATVTDASSGISGQCSVVVTSTAVPNQLPVGFHDLNDNTTCYVYGWTTDPDDKNIDLSVRIYSDGALVKTGTANKPRGDLEAAGVCPGGTCSFYESLSGLITPGAAHSITVRGVDAQTGAEQNLTATPKSITCSAVCTGNINVTSNVATTWSLSGPSPQTQGTQAASKNYTGLSCGSYTITPASIPGHITPNPAVAPAAAQTLSSGGTLTYTFTYTPLPAATVDLKANSSDAPPAIVIGSQAALSWTTANIKANSCTASAAPASAGWSGAKTDNGSQNSAVVNAQTVFTLTCRNAADTANVIDSVTVSVRPPQCGDGIDNDGDTKVDAEDPGCGGGGGGGDDDDDDDDNEGNTWPQCSDNADNADAEDTLIDENDPGCLLNGVYDPDDNDEQNAGVVIGACNDGLDNDGDGSIDGADDGCADDGDPSELGEPDIREI